MNKKNFLQSLQEIAESNPGKSEIHVTSRTQDNEPAGQTVISAFAIEKPCECSFCHVPKPPEELEPEEGGNWACWDCLARWAEQDRREEEKRIKKEKRY